MMRILSRRYRQFELSALLLIGVFIASMTPVHRMLLGQNDFVHFYIGGLLYGTTSIHNPTANEALQKLLIGHTVVNSFFGRPTFYGFFLKPLSWISYLPAYAIFQALSVMAAGGFLWIQGKHFKPIFSIAAISVPLIINFVNGQDVTFVLLFAAISLALARQRQDFIGGAILTLCGIKAHLFLLTPIAILRFRRWRLFWGGVCGAVALAILSLAAGGLEVQYQLAREMAKPEHSPYRDAMPNIRNLIRDDSVLLVSVVLIVIAVVIYLVRESMTLEEAFGWTLIGSLLISVHAYVQDCLVIFFALTLLNETASKAVRVLLYLAVLPFIFLALLAGGAISGIYAALLLAVLLVGMSSKFGSTSSSAISALQCRRPWRSPPACNQPET